MRIILDPAPPAACDLAEGFLQSAFWGAFKAEFGWRPRHFRVEVEGIGSAPLIVLERNLGAGLRFAYVPHGPELEMPVESRSGFLADLARALKPRLGPRCIFVRFDPPWYLVEEPRAEIQAASRTGTSAEAGAAPEVPASKVDRPKLGAPLRRAAADIQPPDTVLLDLRPGEEELLAAMKPKWRYNVRLAARKGVAVEEAGADALGEFYRLYEATAARDRIALHPLRYYERQFALAASWEAGAEGRRPDLRLWVARHEGAALAAIITLFRGPRAVYLYGASSDERRELMPAYALQWAAIRAAKAAGCVEYDFYGIPPTDDPGHPMAGLYRFKTGFGGSIAHRAGSWDFPLDPILYSLFRAAEDARRWYFKDFRKRALR